MKLTDEDKYRLGYAQGYYDALESMSEDVNRKFGKECLNCQEWDCTWCPVYVEYKEKIKRWEDEHNT